MPSILNDDDEKEESFSVHSYISGAGSDNADDLSDDNKSSLPQDEARWMAVRKTVRQYKAAFVLNEMKAYLEKLIDGAMKDLQIHENNKIQRYNSPKSSLFDWFKSSNQIHPASTMNMKPLPPEQAAEFALAKEIFANIYNYILSQNNLDLVIKASKNVANEYGQEIIDTGDSRDIQISLWTTIDSLRKGDFQLPTDSETDPGRKIKDSGVLKVLRQFAETFNNFGPQIQQFLNDTIERVDVVVRQHLDASYNEFVKINPQAGFGTSTHDDRVRVLLTELPKPEFVTMLRNLNTKLVSHKPPEELDQKPTLRRGNWV